MRIHSTLLALTACFAALPAAAVSLHGTASQSGFTLSVTDLAPDDGRRPFAAILRRTGYMQSQAYIDAPWRFDEGVATGWLADSSADVFTAGANAASQTGADGLSATASNSGEFRSGSRGFSLVDIFVAANTAVTVSAQALLDLGSDWALPDANWQGNVHLELRQDLVTLASDDFTYASSGVGSFAGSDVLSVTFVNSLDHGLRLNLRAWALVELTSPVPEPAAPLLMLAGLGLLAAHRRQTGAA